MRGWGNLSVLLDPIWKAKRKGPKTLVYSRARVAKLVAKAELDIQRAILDAFFFVKENTSLETLSRLIQEGKFDEAAKQSEAALARVAQRSAVWFVKSGEDVAEFLERGMGVVVDFDQTNHRAVSKIQSNRLNLIREFSQQKRELVREVVTDGIRRGSNPRVIARDFRDSIGLTKSQRASVANFNRLLRNGSSQALTRQLRDGRSDARIRAAFSGKGPPLSPEEIQMMTDRYRKNFIAHRAETIARTEALRAVHQGNEEMFEQAFESGTLPRDSVEKEWHNSGDRRVRDPAHVRLGNQKVKEGEKFLSGLGNRIGYPGDPEAPGEETIQCRCRVSRRIVLPAEAGR